MTRHGESEWNASNRFTGWVDVPLSSKGILQAQAVGKKLRDLDFIIDYGYTSLLKRAIKTLWLILEETDQMMIPIIKHCAFNERHYGRLQGAEKNAMIEKYGAHQVQEWRRSYKTMPPPLSADSQRKQDQQFEKMRFLYQQQGLTHLPIAESLAAVEKRVVLHFKKVVLRQLEQGKRILIVSHGNSIRALIKWLEKISDEQILHLDIPTGSSRYYNFDASKGTFNSLVGDCHESAS